ncbi:hypothetical protein BDQ12DRAFT_240383 [Crucibulum laeve]|uniref:Uncharacterized protein n=1 Tax=Crucibulum laeve TaxID=68775 RepID=A0A5C3LVC0_9AGAR|nr:hypothetical protein BDQ12DRAFT_240383 [Crucibulum laeve]
MDLKRSRGIRTQLDSTLATFHLARTHTRCCKINVYTPILYRHLRESIPQSVRFSYGRCRAVLQTHVQSPCMIWIGIYTSIPSTLIVLSQATNHICTRHFPSPRNAPTAFDYTFTQIWSRLSVYRPQHPPESQASTPNRRIAQHTLYPASEISCLSQSSVLPGYMHLPTRARTLPYESEAFYPIWIPLTRRRDDKTILIGSWADTPAMLFSCDVSVIDCSCDSDVMWDLQLVPLVFQTLTVCE